MKAEPTVAQLARALQAMDKATSWPAGQVDAYAKAVVLGRIPPPWLTDAAYRQMLSESLTEGIKWPLA